MPDARLELGHPFLREEGYTETSDATGRYNCIAWAIGDQTTWWESPGDDTPTMTFGQRWPEGIPNEDTVAAIIAFFQLHQFVRCDSGDLEPGIEKIAIYSTAGGSFQHVARQLACGHWTSKLGKWEDIRHNTIHALEGGKYGLARTFLRRDRPE